MACDAGAVWAATQKYFAQNYQRSRAGAGSLCPKNVDHLKLSRKLAAVYLPPVSSGIKALTNRLSSSICSDVARSLDEDFDSSHSSAAVGLSFLSSRGNMAAWLRRQRLHDDPRCRLAANSYFPHDLPQE